MHTCTCTYIAFESRYKHTLSSQPVNISTQWEVQAMRKEWKNIHHFYRKHTMYMFFSESNSDNTHFRMIDKCTKLLGNYMYQCQSFPLSLRNSSYLFMQSNKSCKSRYLGLSVDQSINCSFVPLVRGHVRSGASAWVHVHTCIVHSHVNVIQ